MDDSMTTQPEALLLADALEREVWDYGDHKKAAAELRRLYEVNERLFRERAINLESGQRDTARITALETANAELLEALGRATNYDPLIARAQTAIREVLAQPQSNDNGGKTGWPPGLMQDDDKHLSKWLANRPGVRHQMLDNLAQELAMYRASYAQLVKEANAAEETLIQLNQEIDQLRAFAQGVLDGFPDYYPDGFDLQDLALKHGLLEPFKVTQPCCEGGCQCAEYYAPDELAEGVECYRKSALLKGTK